MPPTERNLLSGRYDLAAVREALIDFNPDTHRRYPAANDREAWANIPAEARTRLLAHGESRLNEPWEPLLASVLLDYPRNGNRVTYHQPQQVRRSRLQELALAECIEGKGRFLDAIVDGIWLICEETWWGYPAHLEEQKVGADLPDISDPTVELGVGETASQLAWIDHLLGEQLDSVSKLIRPRIKREIHRQLLDPAFERDDFWWMSWDVGRHTINNWNPWVNSNWLACVLLMERDPERRARAVQKIMRSLDLFINHLPADGGCDEGPGYWDRAGGSLFDCLEHLDYATSGKFSFADQPIVQETGRFIMRAHIDGDWLVNYADASPKANIDGTLVQRFGHYIKDQALVDFGSWVQQHQAKRPYTYLVSINRTLGILFGTKSNAQTTSPPLFRDVWLPNLQFMTARSETGTSEGFYLGAKGGHNDESHNHNDVGSFIVYLDGKPLVIDVGSEVYTARTFSSERYDIWTMQSQWHNLPTINGTLQQNGETFAAREISYQAEDTAATFALDIAGSYPESAAVSRWTRTFKLERQGPITLTDDYALSEAREPTVWNFMLLSAPEHVTDGQIRLRTSTGGAALLTYEAGRYDYRVDKVELTDIKMTNIWGDQVYRLQLIAKQKEMTGHHEFSLRIEAKEH